MFKKFLCIASLMLCALLLFSCGEETVGEGQMIARLVSSGKEIRITAAFSAETAEANRDKTLYLFEIENKVSPLATMWFT